MNKINVKLIDKNENTFNLLSIAKKEMKNNNISDSVFKEMQDKNFQSNSYDEAQQIINEHVNIV